MTIRTKLNILPKTANYTVLASDSNSKFSNEGAGAMITFTLPAPEIGMTFGFYVDDVDGVTIVPTTAIRLGTNAIGGVAGVKSLDIGSFIQITCFKTGEWVAESLVGNWSNA